MKFGYCEVTNFASYKELQLDFREMGLTLVHGPTGSGKSTICDMICWIMFGKTAKGGAVDDIKSWGSEEEPTIGRLELELPGGGIQITRVRGKAPINDLFWTEDSVPLQRHRGKDIVETQKLLNTRIGVDVDLYTVSAYFSEFSTTSRFFISKAKDRRAVLESIADLSFPILLAEKLSEERKEIKNNLATLETTKASLSAVVNQLSSSLISLQKSSDKWEKDQKQYIRTLSYDYENFNKNRDLKIQKITSEIHTLNKKIVSTTSLDAKIKELRSLSEKHTKEVCDKCGASKDSSARLHYAQELTRLSEEKGSNNTLIAKRESLTQKLTDMEDTPDEYLKRLNEEKAKENPFTSTLSETKAALSSAIYEEAEKRVEIAAVKSRQASVECLISLSSELRTHLLQNVISQAEEMANSNLEKYFDSEIKISLVPEGADNLEVLIHKSGHECSYKQLSKGQRSMLQLCFSVAIMELSANQAGIHFDTLIFDEVLDGQDPQLKSKVYGLFESLSLKHSSVILVDHSEEFKSLFSNKISVSMVGDYSIINRDYE